MNRNKQKAYRTSISKQYSSFMRTPKCRECCTKFLFIRSVYMRLLKWSNKLSQQQASKWSKLDACPQNWPNTPKILNHSPESGNKRRLLDQSMARNLLETHSSYPPVTSTLSQFNVWITTSIDFILDSECIQVLQEHYLTLNKRPVYHHSWRRLSPYRTAALPRRVSQTMFFRNLHYVVKKD